MQNLKFTKFVDGHLERGPTISLLGSPRERKHLHKDLYADIYSRIIYINLKLETIQMPISC